MDNPDAMMNVNIEMKDLKSRRYIAKPEHMQEDYVPHALPTSAIEESVMKPVLPLIPRMYKSRRIEKFRYGQLQ